MPVKSAKKSIKAKPHSKRPIRAKKSTARERQHARILPSPPQTLTAQAVVVAAMCVAGAVMLIAAHEPAARTDASGVDVRQASALVPSESTALPQPDVAPIAGVKAPAAAVAVRSRMPAVTKAPAAVEPVKAPPTELATKSVTTDFATEAAATPLLTPALPALNSTPTPVVQGPPPVTITGCLQFDDGAYRLKDATGDDALKTRSWKSGFLRKRATAIDVVDPANSQQLSAYVGQRIAATGTLENREIHVRSVQRLAAACN